MNASTVPKPETADVPPPLALRAASAVEYCRAIRAARRAEMWWFQTGLAPYRGYSQPFADSDGRWWWKAKPQFAWPVDLITPLEQPPRVPRTRAAMGHQYPVAAERANSKLRFNVVGNLTGYDISSVASQKRRAVRKGLKSLTIAPLDARDAATLEEARIVWNSHVERTGWNTQFDGPTFVEHWRPLPDTPGTHVIGARSAATGLLCAWLITRIVEGTVWIDTIASHTERVDERPNDALIFTALYHGSRLPGVRHANYFLKSSLEPLEQFKQSLGFDSSGIPAWLHVNPLLAWPLRRFKPGIWKRLLGEEG